MISQRFDFRRLVAAIVPVPVFIFMVFASTSVNLVQADLVQIDLKHTPGGDPVSEGTVLSNQYLPIGAIFGARRSNEPVLQDSATISPISAFHADSDRGFLFFNPDVLGAVGIIHFVQPNTNTPAQVISFEGIADRFFHGNETIEIVAFDDAGQVVASSLFYGTAGPFATVSVESTTPFSAVEIRTSGDPGVAVGNLQFTTVPEPASWLLWPGVAGALALVRRRR